MSGVARIPRLLFRIPIANHAGPSRFPSTQPLFRLHSHTIIPLTTPSLTSKRLPSLSTSLRPPIRSFETSTTPPQSTTSPHPPTPSPFPDPSASSSSSSSSPPPEPEPNTAYARFRLLTKRYGWWALAMYTVLSAADFSLVLLSVHTLGADRFESLLSSITHQYRVTRHGHPETEELEREDEERRLRRAQEVLEEEKGLTPAEKKKMRSGGYGSRAMWAEVAIAYAIHKTALLPLRAGLTVAWTPKLVGWLTARGWVGKGGITRAATHAQGKIKTATEKVRDAAKVRREGST